MGSGPIDAAAWGLGLVLPLGSGVAATAEGSGWGNGFGGTTCIAMPPGSHRCSVSGLAGLLGLRLTVPGRRRPAAYGEVAGGVFSRDWIGDERVTSAALSAQAGIVVRIHGPLDARVGVRYLRAFDEDYRSLLDEDLEYRMVTLVLAYRVGSPP